MSAHIQGMAWVTPLGAGLDEVWQRLMSGESADPREISCADSPRKHFYFAVPPTLVEKIGHNPRLRRSSNISCFAAAAGLAALENAGVEITPDAAETTAVVFAIASGGVIYTRKFYDQIVKQGANAASPLLFPETVYNAPASHLAALLGSNGMSYTIVGDGSVGISAIKFAEQLLETTDVERCVVVGAEEIDWVLCEAYREWRLTSAKPTIALNARKPRGTLLAEGAGALVLGREGIFKLPKIHAGQTFFKQTDATAALNKVHADLAHGHCVNAVIGCANGTFLDRAERDSVTKFFPQTPVYSSAPALGCAIGSGGIWQTILAALALKSDALPPLTSVPEALADRKLEHVLVSCAGWNQQASGLIVEKSPSA